MHINFLLDSCNSVSGPTTVKVRVTGLTPGLHGFHLVSAVLRYFYSSIQSKLVISNIRLFFPFQHEHGDTTNGCISTGLA